MRFDGVLKTWNDERGFGFIEPVQGGQDIFVHIKALPEGTGRPAVGLALSFEIELGPQGKKRAKAVQFARAGSRTRQASDESPAPWTVARVLAIPGFALFYAFAAQRWPVPHGVAAVYVLASGIAFMVYAFDKSAAIQGRRRVAEVTLHGLGIVGGWPGALLAQQLLRHKTAKPSFVAAFWHTVLLNLAGFVALYSPWLRALRL